MSWEKKFSLGRSVSKGKLLQSWLYISLCCCFQEHKQEPEFTTYWEGFKQSAPIYVFSEIVLNRNTTREMEFALGLSLYCDLQGFCQVNCLWTHTGLKIAVVILMTKIWDFYLCLLGATRFRKWLRFFLFRFPECLLKWESHQSQKHWPCRSHPFACNKWKIESQAKRGGKKSQWGEQRALELLKIQPVRDSLS